MRKVNFNKFYATFIAIVTFFISVGYAVVSAIVVQISGNVSANMQEGVFISATKYSESVSADLANSDIVYAYQTNLNTKVALSETDSTSSITYEILMYNSDSYDYVFDGVKYMQSDETYSNTDITFSLTGIAEGDILPSKQTAIFYITFSYLNNQISSNNTLNSLLNFKYVKIYYVNYENFLSTTNYPTYVREGENLNVSFGQLDAPIEVKQNGTILSESSYNYSNYTLSLSQVSGTLNIRKKTKNTMRNLITNGSFENGFNGWSFSGSSASQHWGLAQIPKLGNYCAYRQAAKSGQHFIYQSIYFETGHKYFLFGYAISTAPQTFVCDISGRGGTFSVTSGPNDWVKGGSVYASTFTGYNNVNINWGELTDNINIDCIGIVDLTKAFGAGKEPEVDWCRKHINYFDTEAYLYT